MVTYMKKSLLNWTRLLSLSLSLSTTFLCVSLSLLCCELVVLFLIFPRNSGSQEESSAKLENLVSMHLYHIVPPNMENVQHKKIVKLKFQRDKETQVSVTSHFSCLSRHRKKKSHHSSSCPFIYIYIFLFLNLDSCCVFFVWAREEDKRISCTDTDSLPFISTEYYISLTSLTS